MTQFVVTFNESEHFTLYSTNHQREKVKIRNDTNIGRLFFNIEQVLCKINAEKLNLFTATLSITSEQIKNISRGDLKYVITKTLEEKFDDEERTEEQKCEVFKQILTRFKLL